MNWYQVFVGSAEAIGRTAVVGGAAYAGLVFLLRLTGKRTLSKLNAFDLVVTVALGSTLASILLSRDVSLAQGMLALALLVGLQLLITWSSVHLPWVRAVVTGEPSLVFFRGRMLVDAMRRERVTESEVMAILRMAGDPSPDRVEAVVLETDGSFSVVAQAPEGRSTLRGVRLPEGAKAATHAG